MTATRAPKPRDHHLLAEHRVAMVAALGFLFIALTVFVLLGNGGTRGLVDDIDLSIRGAAQDIQWAPLTALAHALNILGSWSVTWPLRAAVAAWLAFRQRSEALIAWLAAIVVYEPLVGMIKDAYARPRPPHPIVEVTGYSFPSGHATVGAAIAIGLVIVLVPAGPRRRLLEVAAGGFAFFMAASRVYLDAHWMTDVIAGTALGAAVMVGTAATVHEIGDRLHWRRIEDDAGG